MRVLRLDPMCGKEADITGYKDSTWSGECQADTRNTFQDRTLGQLQY